VAVEIPLKPDAAGWARHNLEQLRLFRRFDLRAKLAAVEGMADVVRHFAALRVAGKLTEPAAPASGEFDSWVNEQDWGI
jgi:hypothetical protein